MPVVASSKVNVHIWEKSGLTNSLHPSPCLPYFGGPAHHQVCHGFIGSLHVQIRPVSFCFFCGSLSLQFFSRKALPRRPVTLLRQTSFRSSYREGCQGSWEYFVAWNVFILPSPPTTEVQLDEEVEAVHWSLFSPLTTSHCLYWKPAISLTVSQLWSPWLDLFLCSFSGSVSPCVSIYSAWKLLVCPVTIQTVPSLRLLPSWKVLSCSLFKYLNELNEFLSRPVLFLLALSARPIPHLALSVLNSGRGLPIFLLSLIG